MNLNYTSICHYCGEIYHSCRSSSKYCCSKHNALFHQNGPQINNNIMRRGVWINYKRNLGMAYSSPGGAGKWGACFDKSQLLLEFGYNGPLPDGDEIILVSGYLIKTRARDYPDHLFAVKPFHLLTREEKASKFIAAAKYDTGRSLFD